MRRTRSAKLFWIIGIAVVGVVIFAVIRSRPHRKTLSIVVKDDKAQPLERTKIQVQGSNSQYLTNMNGVAKVPLAERVIVALSRFGYETKSDTLQLLDLVDQWVEYQLQPRRYQIRLKVVDARQTALDKAAVYRDNILQGRTRPDGTLLLAAAYAAGGLELTIKKTGYKTLNAKIGFSTEEKIIEEEFILEPGAFPVSLQGTVTDSLGNPAAAIKVYNSKGKLLAETDDAGNFSLSLQARPDQPLWLRFAGDYIRPDSAMMQVSPEQLAYAVQETVSALPRALRFRIRDGGTQRPVEKATAYLIEQGRTTYLGASDAAGNLPVRLRGRAFYNFLVSKGGYEKFAFDAPAAKLNPDYPLYLHREYARVSFRAIEALTERAVRANVIVDDKPVGLTPILSKTFAAGFYKLELRAFEEKKYARLPAQGVEFVKGDTTFVARFYPDFFGAGQEKEMRKDFIGAMAEYEKITYGHPDYWRGRLQLGELLTQPDKPHTDLRRAIEVFEEILRHPEYDHAAIGLYFLGLAYHGLAEHRSSTKYFEQALLNSANFPADRFEKLVHNTRFYLAAGYQRLAQNETGEAKKKDLYLRKALQKWQEYFDFLPATAKKDNYYKPYRKAADQNLKEAQKLVKQLPPQ